MNKLTLSGFIFTLSLSLTACDRPSPQAETDRAVTPPENSSPSAVQKQLSVSDTSETVVIKHGNGETAVMKHPKKVVTMDFATLDSLDKLNLANVVVAFPKSNLPDYLDQYGGDRYTDAGKMKEPNLEAIRALRPDLIVITGRQGKSYPQLSEIAPTVALNVDAKDYRLSVEQNARILASLFDKQPEVTQALALLDKKIADYQGKARESGLTALVVIHNAGKLGVANAGSYATIVHDLAGFTRADKSEEPKRQAADEVYLTTVNPDIIFVVDRSAAIGQGSFNPELLAADTLKEVRAIKNGKVVILTPDLWYLSGGGLESLDLQLDEVIAALN